MAFEVYTPSTTPRLAAGCATIARNGQARFNLDDLRSVGIHESATIMIDRQARTIGIRAPRAGEQQRTVNRARGESPTVYIGGAMLAMGMKPSEHAGPREVTIKDGVIVMEIHG